MAHVIPLPSGRTIKAKLPTYQMPSVRKHASGYFVAPGMDVIDLFIGSEGTLGVIVEAEVKLLPKPEGLLSGVVFFDDEEDLLAFVREARERSLRKSCLNPTVREATRATRCPRTGILSITESLSSCVRNTTPFLSKRSARFSFEQETTPGDGRVADERVAGAD